MRKNPPVKLLDLFALTTSFFKNNSILYLPFIIFFAVEFFCLILTYLSNYNPLLLVFGPIVKTFWGEQFLHFPFNFVLLPKIASFLRILLSISIGPILSGIATLITINIYYKKSIKLEGVFLKVLRKYFTLFFILLILNVTLYFAFKLIGLVLFKYFSKGNQQLFFIPLRYWSYGPIPVLINFMIAVFFQAAFIFAIPFIMLDDEKPIKAIIRSFVLYFKYFKLTSVLVILLMLIYLPILILNMKTMFLIENIFPEFIMIVAILGSILSSLVIDPLLTVASTLLFIKTKEIEQK